MNALAVFDTRGLPPDEAFAQYSTLYAHGSDVARLGGPFHARVGAVRLDRSLLFERRYGGLRHSRAGRARQDGLDHFVLHHVTSGALRVNHATPPFVVTAGQTLVLDTSRPMDTQADEVGLISLSIARSVIRAVIDVDQGLHGQVVTAAKGRMLAAYLTTLVASAPTLSATAQAAALRAGAELLSVALDGTVGLPSSNVHRLDGARRDVVRQAVDARLAQGRIQVDDLIEATSIARATLYRLFTPFGGIARYVVMRRIERLCALLEDRGQDERSLGELARACGFASESHAARQFRETVGMPPGAYRTLHKRAQLDGSVRMLVGGLKRALADFR